MWPIHLAPDQHRTEDDLKPVEEVVSDDDDGGATWSPALARTDGFDARSSRKRWINSCKQQQQQPVNNQSTIKSSFQSVSSARDPHERHLGVELTELNRLV